jgi:hypothetical protein
MKQPEYTEGPEATENFESAMKTIFKAPKKFTTKKGKQKDKPNASRKKSKSADRD